MSEAAEQYPSWMEALAQAIATGDPLLFATDVLGFLMPGVPNPDRLPQLEPWQVVALRKFRKAWRRRFDRPGRLSIRSGHGIGKTCFLSIIILFCLLAGGLDTKIPVVANSQDQLRDGLWPELNKWMQKLPEELRAEIVWEKEKLYLKDIPEGVFAVRRTASKHRPEALQGIHADTVLAVFEEASGIPEETIEAGAGTLSTPGALAVAAGNPTRRTGFFHKTHTALRDTWDCMVVSSEDVPRARGHIADIIKLYGKDSNKYRVRVLGEFPTKDDDVVIPLEWIESAKGRKVAISHVWPVWGCDAARFGDDRITLLKRQGNTLLKPPRVWRNMDGGQVAGNIVADYRATPFDEKPKAICVDVIGYGASVVDFLNRDPELASDDVMIVSVNVAESDSNDGLNHRLRDELWWKGREWFQGKDVCIRTEHLNGDELALIEQLIAELATPTYDFTAAGKRIVMTKAEMKKELSQSPDIADGFLNTFAAPVFPRPAEDWDRHRARNWDRMEVDPWAS
jgi:phage terminase large subunit